MIDLKKITPLETDRLILRKFKDDDAQMLYDNWGSDLEVSKYMLWKNNKSIDDAKNSIEYYKKCYEENANFRQYAIELKETGEVIGQISFEINKKHHNADIAYLLGKNYWKKGYMTEAINRLVDYLFDELNCIRVSAEVMIDNIPSINLLRKCNFIEEGIEHKKYLNKQKQFTDVVLFAKINNSFKEN